MQRSLGITLLTFALLAVPAVQAAESATGQMHQDMQKSMDAMRQGMQASMQTENPDLGFAKGMLAHHQGAVDMAKTELKYGKDPEMRKLAEAIIQAQEKEIDQLQRWIKAHAH